MKRNLGSRMITIVTSTVVTVAMVVSGAALGALATFLLISLLSARSVAIADWRNSSNAFGRGLNIAIVPLLMIFALTVVLKIIEVF